ncbi:MULTISPECIES: OmpP1/FadL family transporter [unclassified Leptospira]|uniref:OmpP1/FadL family transporter n=1 Tax=unclassified Leptospira TaxID=2633828 RepID=UPI0002BE0AC2|nr:MULTISPECIES: outer membrane protein transport protein [unclassified Leptospira]EMJ99548.1 transporter, Ompp1/FadL/TodX family [Leptospira sp. B5-022]MCR1792400.1 outer membrane protein transport protein [Leptospira sp. id769339]
MLFGSRVRKKFSLFSLAIISFLAPKLEAVGLFQPSHNARYGGMGGVNLAIGGSPMDIGTNPANLSLKNRKELEFGISLPYIRTVYKDKFLDPDPNLTYENSESYNVLAPLPYFAIRIPLGEKWSYGGGIYIPGGGNGEVYGLTRITPNGQSLNDWSGMKLPSPIGDSKRIQESYSSTFYLVKSTHALSYKIGGLSLAFGVEGIYSRQIAYQKFHDITGTVEVPGQGFDYRSKHAYALGGIFGTTYQITETLKIAYTYQTSAKIPLDGSIQVGSYPSRTGVSATFAVPERHGFGFSYGTDTFNVGIDVLYYNYSSYTSIYKQTLAAPVFPTAFGQTNVVPQNLSYHDSWALGIGGEWIVNDWTYRLGARHNSGVLRSEGTNALQAGIMVQDLVSGGFGYTAGKWKFDFTLLYYLPVKVYNGGSADWNFNHAVFSKDDIRVAQFKHSLRSDIPAILLGASYSFN